MDESGVSCSEEGSDYEDTSSSCGSDQDGERAKLLSEVSTQLSNKGELSNEIDQYGSVVAPVSVGGSTNY